MVRLTPPSRGRDPLHVLAMALALVAASIAGAGIGFALDLFNADDAAQASKPPPAS